MDTSSRPQESETFSCVSWVCHRAYRIIIAAPLVTCTPCRTTRRALLLERMSTGDRLAPALGCWALLNSTLKPLEAYIDTKNCASHSSLIFYEKCRDTVWKKDRVFRSILSHITRPSSLRHDTYLSLISM